MNPLPTISQESPLSWKQATQSAAFRSRLVMGHLLLISLVLALPHFFDYIVPCGISDKKVTSMEKELGNRVNEQKVKELFLEKFAEVFDVAFLEDNLHSHL